MLRALAGMLFALTIGEARADTYQIDELSGSYTEITAYNFDNTGNCFGGEFSCGPVSYSGEVTYDLTTQTFSTFSIAYAEFVSVGADYAAQIDVSFEPPQPFDYPPGTTITTGFGGGGACGANPENCVDAIISSDIIQTAVTPLPGTLALFACGLGALGLLRRKPLRRLS